MTRHSPRLALALLVLTGSVLQAQDQTSALVTRGVPAGIASKEPLQLSLADAVRRGLAQNLAVIIQQQHLQGAESERLAALSQLLPRLSGSVRQSNQVLSTAAFGFTLPDLPTIIGPFGVFDARLTLSTPLFDARARGAADSVKAQVRAAQADVLDIRETVVLAVGNLYLQAQADHARVESARAQVTTADALVRLAEDRRASGLVAGIDVLRQQVQLESARARVIVAENALEKRRLLLARAIGLPADQAFVLTDAIQFLASPAVTVDDAVADAAAHRDDLKAAQARVDAAKAALRAESAARLPTVHLDADLGVLGPQLTEVERTYSIAGAVHIPIFDGRNARARTLRADAELRQREAVLADLTGGIRYDIEAALLDLKAAAAGVQVADSARRLTAQELDQAQDRFRAGVSSTLELVQAQEAVASAADQYIASVYAHTVAKASLARAMGQVEQRFVELVGGKQP